MTDILTPTPDEEGRTFTIPLRCGHCGVRRTYRYPFGTRLFTQHWGVRTETLRMTRCGVCGVVGELKHG